jgi:hypothetical protein
MMHIRLQLEIYLKDLTMSAKSPCCRSKRTQIHAQQQTGLFAALFSPLQEMALVIERMQHQSNTIQSSIDSIIAHREPQLSSMDSLVCARRRSATSFSTGVLPIYPRFPDRDVRLGSLRLAPHQTSNWPGTFPSGRKGRTVLCCAVNTRG